MEPPPQAENALPSRSLHSVKGSTWFCLGHATLGPITVAQWNGGETLDWQPPQDTLVGVVSQRK